MSKKAQSGIDPLGKACATSGAKWAVWVARTPSHWEILDSHGLAQARRAALGKFLADPKSESWLAQSAEGTKPRSRALGGFARALGAGRVYAFPHPRANVALLAGAEKLNKGGQALFEIVSLQPPNRPGEDGFVVPASLPDEPQAAPSSMYEEGQTFQRVLDSLRRRIPSRAAYLALRVGNVFRVAAVDGYPSNFIGNQLLLGEHPALEKMVASHAATTLESGTDEIPLRPGGAGQMYWLGLPLVIGQRVIGYLAFESERGYSPEELQQAEALAQHVSPSVENAIVHAEAAHYLQRFALLNELASLASVNLSVVDVAQRVQRMLNRALDADYVSLLLLSPEDNMLHDVGAEAENKGPRLYPIEFSLAGAVAEKGQAVRVGDVSKYARYLAVNPDVCSKLAVPLKFDGKVMGVLALESKRLDAYSQQDEQFAIVISSQIAGLIANARLNEETHQRARNLGMINEIIQQVVGRNNVSEIAQIAAARMVDRFGYDLVSVMLLDRSANELVVEGFSSIEPELSIRGGRYAMRLGLFGQVLQHGGSLLIEDVSADPNYLSLPGWKGGSQMCVPLREGEKVFGIISVEVQRKRALGDNDLQVLEALAGVLSSVIMYAWRYQQLQVNVRHLQAVRETALDISADLDLDVLLKRVVNRVRELVNARGAELGLVDESERVVRVLVSENPWQDYTGYTFPLMAGITGRVAAMGEPLVVADYNTWSGKGEGEFKAPFTTVAGVPLKLSGETIGTLVVQDDRSGRSFGPEDIQVLELLAPQLSIFIRNARLYQELAERIEAQRLAEARLVRSAKLAAVGEMAAGVAHELNNPLTTVAGFAELILDELPEDFPQREDVAIVLQEAQRARDVVRRLLDFSRQGELLRSEADINEVLADVLALVHHLARTSGVETRVQLWHEMPVVRIDRNQMQQVFLNIIHNAIQAMPSGGELVIQTQVEKRADGPWIAVVVRDSGEGIQAEHLGQIFEPFFTTKPSGHGTGLGLSVSYGIVADHGGFIEVESKPGAGSTFTVWLPVQVPVAIRQESLNA